MAAQNAPLDEIQYRAPHVIQWWLTEGGQPMDENMIHRYLAESPFFDYTTKNGLVMDQSRTVQQAWEMTKNRRALEEQLKKQTGTEYMIVGDPQPIPGATDGAKTGMYVIRKQDRRKQRAADGRVEDELTTLGTYYVVGESMHQAASVGDILGNRILSAVTSMSKFFDQACDLPSFSPTAGYSYLPQSTRPAASISTQPSPTHSREASVIPGADTQSLRSGSLQLDSRVGGASHASNMQDARLLARSMEMAIQFGDEYADENPIIGEPAHFSFTSSTAAVKKRKAEEEAAAAAAKIREQQQTASRIATPKADKAPSPPAVMTEAKSVKDREKDRRGSKMGEKIRRKKSRPNVQSPTTPNSAASTLPPNSAS